MAATYYVGFVALCGRIDLLHRRFRRSIGRDRSATSPLVSSLLAAGSICYFTSSEQRPQRAAACLSFDGKTAAPVPRSFASDPTATNIAKDPIVPRRRACSGAERCSNLSSICGGCPRHHPRRPLSSTFDLASSYDVLSDTGILLHEFGVKPPRSRSSERRLDVPNQVTAPCKDGIEQANKDGFAWNTYIYTSVHAASTK
jgi:hypothetical protein